MIDVVYVSDKNKMGSMKFKWLKDFIESNIDGAILRQEFDPSGVFGIYEQVQDGIIHPFYVPEYNVIYDAGKEEGVVIGDNEWWESHAQNPDVVIIDDLTRANPACDEKIYNRSRVLYECIKRGVQTHVIAPDLTMSYAGGLELDRKTKLPFSIFKDFSNVHVWYGVNNIEDVKKVSTWNQIWKKMPNSIMEKNLITGVCYYYLKKHRKEIRESMKDSVAYSGEHYDNYAYYGFWRRGVLKDNVINSGVDTIIGTFKWRPFCEEKGINWQNGNKTLEEIFGQVTKAYIPYENPKSDVQHVFRQFEGIVYARDGVVYDEQYPEHMRVYDLNDQRLKDTYSPVLSKFLDLVESSIK